MNMFRRLAARWAFRGAPPQSPNTIGLPTEQTEQLSADQKWAKEHGIPVATVPLPATAEISAHNAAIEAEYQAEVSRRRGAYARGEYQPRFYVLRADAPLFLTDMPTFAARPDWYEVNWDLEMSMLPGRRLDVTQDSGIEPLPMPTANDVADARTLDALHEKVETVKAAQAMEPEALLTSDAIVRKLVGDEETLLAACGGNEELAEQVRAKARVLAEDIKKHRQEVGIEASA